MNLHLHIAADTAEFGHNSPKSLSVIATDVAGTITLTVQIIDKELCWSGAGRPNALKIWNIRIDT